MKALSCFISAPLMISGKQKMRFVLRLSGKVFSSRTVNELMRLALSKLMKINSPPLFAPQWRNTGQDKVEIIDDSCRAPFLLSSFYCRAPYVIAELYVEFKVLSHKRIVGMESAFLLSNQAGLFLNITEGMS